MLTPRQTDILAFIRICLEQRGAPPTRADIVQEFGFASPTAADDHLKALARKGVIELVPGAARGIRLLEAVPQQYQLPLIGRVAAGSPLLALENLERQVPVDAGLFKPRADYLLRVTGESMRDIGIRNGDLLAVHRQATARNGQVVVARLDDEVTVKRYQRRGDVVQLLAENPDFAPIRVDLSRQPLAIEGLAVGLLRTDGFGRL
ncbi:transcriptional repressor LexA [Panacagrimonas sp.]|uniref:transcriptional repressor LexA n=1 Tax=Panacagrimonas sp. TaxID=2480088 RepID=UPI003B52E2EE